jgi:hypothetical protein
VVEKLTEFLDKYVTVGGKLAAAIGNVDKCVVDCQGQCKLNAEQAVEQCIAQGGTPEECEIYGNKVLKSCLNGCVKIEP